MKPQLLSLTLLLGIAFLISCGGENTSSPQPPGAGKTAKTKALEAGAVAMQDRSPLERINVYVDGFHFMNGHPEHQMEEHHYCAKINEDLTQCVLFDGNTEEALMTGVEYLVSRRVFEQLPADEKKLWHSHVYEVKSGQLIAPGLPDAAETQLMRTLVDTYGKIWHTWNTHESKLPTGIPSLLMGFTADGQLNPQLLSSRDKRFGISAAEKAKLRKEIPEPQVLPGANAWEKGEVAQVELKMHKK